jgi:uncharacterized protein (TIGR01244 family)
MPQPVFVDDDLAVTTSAPEGGDLFDFDRAGFRAVVDLEPRTGERVVSVPLEASTAATRGMAYRHIPVTTEPDDATVDRFRAELARLPGPVLVHAAAGERSAALVVMHVASLRGLAGDAALELAASLGLPLEHGALAEAVRRYVDAHRVT